MILRATTEIYTNTLVRLDVTAARSQGLGSFSYSFGSTTQGEAWDVYGSTSANTGLVLLKDGLANDQGATYSLSDQYNFFYFVYDGPPLTYTWKFINVINGRRWKRQHAAAATCSLLPLEASS